MHLTNETEGFLRPLCGKLFTFCYYTGSEEAGVHGDVDADEKERDDILREQVNVCILQ